MYTLEFTHNLLRFHFEVHLILTCLQIHQMNCNMIKQVQVKWHSFTKHVFLRAFFFFSFGPKLNMNSWVKMKTGHSVLEERKKKMKSSCYDFSFSASWGLYSPLVKRNMHSWEADCEEEDDWVKVIQDEHKTHGTTYSKGGILELQVRTKLFWTLQNLFWTNSSQMQTICCTSSCYPIKFECQIKSGEILAKFR